MIQDAWKQTAIGDALYIKNPWGLNEQEQSNSLIEFQNSPGTDRVTVNIDIPDTIFDPAKVRAFPQFTLGLKDSKLTLPAGFTPVNSLVKTLTHGINVMQFAAMDAVLQFRTKTKTSGLCNIASEIFLHEASATVPSNREPNTRVYEIMCWVSSPDDSSIGKGNLLYEADGFKVYTKTGNRRYMAFIMDENVPQEDTPVYIQWSKILRVAMQLAQNSGDLDPISTTYKVFGIETGLEVWSGIGSTFFSGIDLFSIKNSQQTIVSNTLPEPDQIATPTDPMPLALSNGACQTMSTLWQNIVTTEAALNPKAAFANYYPICGSDKPLPNPEEELDVIHQLMLLGERATLMDNLIRLLTIERNNTIATIKERSPENFNGK